MSKWYRPSLSLAAKCRLGFAAAVLLIVAAGLFVPYRWMDKLVEQGKLELAQAEVQHVLTRHFAPLRDPDIPAKSPPLTLNELDRIEPVRRLENERRHQSNLTQDQPLTLWIPLPPPGTPPAEDSTQRHLATSTDTHLMTPPGAPLSHDEAFLRRCIDEFTNDRARRDVFQLNWADAQPPLRPQSRRVTNGWLDNLRTILPWDQPGRYVRAIRAQHTCLSGGCHGGAPLPTESAVTSSDDAQQPPSAPAGPSAFTEGQLVGIISVVLPPGQTSMTLLFNRIFIIVGGLLSSICAVVTFYLITQWAILRPVRKLRRAADHVTVTAADEDASLATNPPDGPNASPPPQSQFAWQEAMNVIASIKTGDDFQRLAEAFHQMLARVKLAQDRLEQNNRALDLRLGELQEKNVALYESNKLKSEFLTNVSHELRTPLNAILGFADIIKEQAQTSHDEKAVRYISNVLKSGQLLLSLINDVLDLSKIEAGKVELRWQKCSLHEIVEALLSLTRPMVEEKQINVNVALDDNIGLIESDPGKLQQILFNLLNNAIKFTPQRGRIDLKARLLDAEHQSDLELQIADTGPGIAESDRETIFEKFHQLDASITREYSGTGLGLAIVKELLDMMGGDIRVGGQPGKGAVFTVRLPIKQTDDLPQQAAGVTYNRGGLPDTSRSPFPDPRR